LKVENNPHPLVLCVTDNISTLNWTLHTSKKSIIDQALERFFCGLPIGSNIGVNAKWISMKVNVIADKILRLVSSNPAPHPSPTYDYSKL
jgi:hypothetical protein